MSGFRSARWRHDHRGLLRKTLAAGVGLTLVAGLATAAAAGPASGRTARVGSNDGNGILLPTNQRLTPLGSRLLLDTGRVVSSSISPDGHYLAALTWHKFTGFLTMVDLRTNKVVQTVGTGAATDPTIGDGSVAADGPLWAPDGHSLWFPQSSDLVRFQVGADGTVSAPVTTVLSTTVSDLNGAKTTRPDLPSGMALSQDGSKLYVALNGVNQLGVISTTTNALLRVTPVGNAPRQVVLVGDRAFVSNEGGRPARPGDVTNLSYGTPIVSDVTTGAATTGTVSVVDLVASTQVKQIPVGLQPTAEYLTRDGTLLVANSNDDSFSIIDPTSSQVTQTVNVNPVPGSAVGSYPNAITMPDDHTILVSIGRDNALAVFTYNGPKVPVQYVGLLPTDFYPVGATYDPAIGKVVVTNDKGKGSRGPVSSIDEGPGTGPAPAVVTGHNSYDDTASITEFAMPSRAQIAQTTHQVFVNNSWLNLPASRPVKGSSAAPKAIPVQLGDPSKIQHVFLIVRENRTYDQVLGDIGKGNSDPTLAQFGVKATPNAHALANTFGLMDNFYDEGTLSADGHNWLVQADANDYIEKEFGAFYRSYPAQGGDALAYQRDGFLWNAAQAAGQTVKAYGEYNNFFTQPSPVPSWSDYYRDSQILEGKAKGPLPVPLSAINTYSDIPSLNAIDDHQFPPFDLGIPDQYRADVWQKSFADTEKSGQAPNLSLIWMPVDHTSGVGTGNPDPVAQVADNDLAIGRMIDTISHSSIWSSSAVFVLEDDSQNGTDHVDGHRAPLLVASPYAKRGVVNSTTYTQLNVVKTIEQILGVAPMNQLDRAAVPMSDAFTDTPDTTPYNVVPNQIPLTQGLLPAAASSSPAGTTAPDFVPQSAAALGIPAPLRDTYNRWVVWSRGGHFSGKGALQDWANPAQLNRLTWYSAHDWKIPYPGETAILTPDQVPGHNLPTGFLGD